MRNGLPFRIGVLAPLAIFLAGYSGGCGHVGLQANTDKEINRIADPDTNENDISGLIADVRAQKQSRDEARVWALIANSERYTPVRRRRAVFELFDQFVELNMTIRQVGELLEHPSWLDRQNISEVTSMAGLIPVFTVPDETVFVILPKLPVDDASAIYLRVDGTTSTGDLFAALQEKPSTAMGLKITAIAIVAIDPADQKLVSVVRDARVK